MVGGAADLQEDVNGDCNQDKRDYVIYTTCQMMTIMNKILLSPFNTAHEVNKNTKHYNEQQHSNDVQLLL